MGLFSNILCGVADALNDSGCDWTCDGCGARMLDENAHYDEDSDLVFCEDCWQERLAHIEMLRTERARRFSF